MMYKFGKTSTARLNTCDGKLINVMKLALTLSKYDFGISCGVRTIEEQKENVAKGVSHTMKSRHLPNDIGESEAVDITVYVNGKITWDSKYFRKVAGSIFKAAFILGIEIEWGGHWENLYDTPHFQLPRSGE